MKNYKYLEDTDFLKKLDLEEHKTQYVRITILDFKTEAAIASIEGKATGGSINLSGSSNMRRTMSCSLLVDPEGIEKQGFLERVYYGNVTEVKNLISMNKKIRAEIGIKNTLKNLGYYQEYDTIWIPLGIYVIKNPNVAKSNSGLNISLTLNDKTALLNGDMGGTIPAATVFSENELYSADASERKVEKILIKDIIKFLVVDFGGENPENVIIEDIPNEIKKVMKWTGNDTLYYYDGKDGLNKQYSLVEIPGREYTRTFEFGEDVGYMLEPFCYPGTLECNAGETVAAMLDKIKNTLGNYEWFYDIWGRFHFQEKKNYLNKSFASTIQELDALGENGYLSTMNLSKTVYTFDESNRKLLTNISNAPQYINIKNDFIVWGATKTVSGADKPIRYHLVFDTKPKVTNDYRLCLVYTDYRGLQQAIVLTDENCIKDAIGNDKTKYYLKKVNGTYMAFHWDEENQIMRDYPDWEICYIKSNDWRTELYFLCLENVNKTFSKNYYSAELCSEWPKICDIRGVLISRAGTYGNKYKATYKDIKSTQYEYFLDFVEGSEGGNFSLSQFNVNNIGRRTKVGKDNSANCIFASTPPNNIILQVGEDDNELLGYSVVRVEEEIYNKLVLGGNQTSAYDKVKELLVQHTHYNEAITLTTIPIYYLEPNTRIHIEDTDTGINGDYIINTISLPLTIGTSNISCTKAIENTI